MNRLDGWIAGLSIALIGCSALFVTYPQIDMQTSSLFYSNGKFVFEKNGLGEIFTVYFHHGMGWIFWMFVVAGALLLTLGKINKYLIWKEYLYIVLTVALAAGLMANVLFKDHWGRARPHEITEFGGNRQFTPAWVISNQCDKNCSFIGGDVSFAFCALAPALLVRRRKPYWVAGAVGFGILIAFGRIAAGAHFLSDCVLAGMLTSLVAVTLQKVFSVKNVS